MTNSEFVSSHLPIGLDPFPFPCIGNSDFTLSDSVWASSLVWFYKNSWVRVDRIQKQQTIPGQSESESFIYPFRKVWFLIVVPKGFRVWCKSIYRHESLSQAPWGAWRNLSPVAAKKVPGGLEAITFKYQTSICIIWKNIFMQICTNCQIPLWSLSRWDTQPFTSLIRPLSYSEQLLTLPPHHMQAKFPFSLCRRWVKKLILGHRRPESMQLF